MPIVKTREALRRMTMGTDPGNDLGRSGLRGRHEKLVGPDREHLLGIERDGPVFRFFVRKTR
jgi:hypothetical protein